MLKKILVLIFILAIIGIVLGFTLKKVDSASEEEGMQKTLLESDIATPEGVVRAYFVFWREKNYAGMYDLFSDGFKKIEPTAATLEDFSAYAKSQGIDAIEITSIENEYQTEKEAGINYKVTFFVHDKIIPYEGTFTLKYRDQDQKPGWKMIHPYGEHIDTS